MESFDPSGKSENVIRNYLTSKMNNLCEGLNTKFVNTVRTSPLKLLHEVMLD